MLTVAESEEVKTARLALGRELAAFRRGGGLSQHQLAPLTYYGRSTVANVEVGRQHVARDFWQRCDELLRADGALVHSYDALEALIRQEREQCRMPPAAPLELASPAQVPEVLAHLREQWHLLVKTDNLLGPRHAFACVLDQIAIIEALLHSTRNRTRTDIAQLAAQYAESAAWLHEDVGDMVRAGQAIGLARAAGRDGDQLPAPMRAAILQQEAQGRALDGDELTSQRLRDRAAALGGLAKAYAAAAEPERAAAVAVQALRIARSSGSTRTLREITAVAQELSRFQTLAPVKVLLDRLADVAV